jgi:hypothetical protein
MQRLMTCFTTFAQTCGLSHTFRVRLTHWTRTGYSLPHLRTTHKLQIAEDMAKDAPGSTNLPLASHGNTSQPFAPVTLFFKASIFTVTARLTGSWRLSPGTRLGQWSQLVSTQTATLRSAESLTMTFPPIATQIILVFLTPTGCRCGISWVEGQHLSGESPASAYTPLHLPHFLLAPNVPQKVLTTHSLRDACGAQASGHVYARAVKRNLQPDWGASWKRFAFKTRSPTKSMNEVHVMNNHRTSTAQMRLSTQGRRATRQRSNALAHASHSTTLLHALCGSPTARSEFLCRLLRIDPQQQSRLLRKPAIRGSFASSTKLTSRRAALWPALAVSQRAIDLDCPALLPPSQPRTLKSRWTFQLGRSLAHGLALGPSRSPRDAALRVPTCARCPRNQPRRFAR